MSVTEYIGPRVGPVFADSAEWTSTRSYEALTVVLHEGNSYTARQDVPVGVQLDNEKYWLETGNYNAQIEQYRNDVLNLRNLFSKYETATNVLSLGIDNNGSADVSSIINAWDMSHNGDVLYFPAGKYLLKSTLAVKNNSYFMTSDATFVAENLHIAVSIESVTTTINDKFFYMNVDGNNSCDICFDVASVIDCYLELRGYDANNIGINLHRYNTAGISSTFKIFYENRNAYNNNIGVICDVSDCKFTQVSIVNVKTGLILRKSGNVFYYYSCWTRYAETFPGTVSIDNQVTNATCFNTFIYATLDTMETFLTSTEHNIGFSLVFDHVFYEFNSSVTPQTKCYLWKLEDMSTTQYVSSVLVFNDLFGSLSHIEFGTTGKCPIRTTVRHNPIYYDFVDWNHDYNYMPTGTWHVRIQTSNDHLPHGLVCPTSICVCETAHFSKSYIQQAIVQATNDAPVQITNQNPLSFKWPYNTVYMRTVNINSNAVPTPISPWMSFIADIQAAPLE